MGLGSNHGDVLHWFPKFGKTMANVRADVKSVLDADKPAATATPVVVTTPVVENIPTDAAAFAQAMEYWIKQQAAKAPNNYSY